MDDGEELKMTRTQSTKLRLGGIALTIALVLGLSGCDSLLKWLPGAGVDDPPQPRTKLVEIPVPALGESGVPAPSASQAVAPGVQAPEAPPPFSRGPLDVQLIKAAKDVERLGAAALKTKDFPSAEREFRRALGTDPGNLPARYGLASVLAQTNRGGQGVALLAPLADTGCPLCLAQLLDAKADPGFATVQQDPQFVALTGNAHRSLLAIPVAAKRMVVWFRKSGQRPLADDTYLDPRALVVIEDRTVRSKARFVQLHGSEAFRKHVEGAYEHGIYASDELQCAAQCCTFAGRRVAAVHLEQMCFKATGMSATYLYKILIRGNSRLKAPR